MDAGKSTLLGVLTHNILVGSFIVFYFKNQFIYRMTAEDMLVRSSFGYFFAFAIFIVDIFCNLRHKHEFESGRTSYV